MLSIEEVKHVAHLARLDLTPKELKLYSAQLSGILNYIDQLAAVDTSAVALGTEISGAFNVWRADEIKDWDAEEREIALKQFNATEKKQLKVARILE
jgi:aspartyl-tRNA(Asn)/glutamyl-tRNA(Gln) amidotransferase subunit C